ncbi:MAG: sigma-70 family RNA polymerase sigma factor [Planctomycetales bacterium]|nr:sigma-70 family RNA polymerase sigma factor [Planctomycetales bacterium]
MVDKDRAELEAAMDGDLDALGRLLVSSHRMLSRRIASKMAMYPLADFDADDVIQEVFVDVHQGISSFDPDKGPWSAWLNRVADNRLTTMLRERSRKKRGGDYKRVEKQPNQDFSQSAIQLVALLADEAGTTPSMAVAKDEMVRALQLGIAQLPDDQREAVLKYCIEERNLDSTADLLSKTDGAVRGLVHRAKKSLKDYLGSSTTWFSR